MKTVTVGNITIEYPEIGFAFNPISIKVSGGDIYFSKSISSGIFNIEKWSDSDNVVFFDVSAISKSLFDKSKFNVIQFQDTTLFRKLEFSLYHKKVLIYTGSIDIIWGALQIGETYTQSKKLKMFKGYPFTVPMFVTENGILQYQVDGGSFNDYIAFNSGKLNIDISQIGANNMLRFLVDSGENYSTFDITFDYTFRGVGVNSIMIEIEVEDTCGENGVYLRWINKHGEYNYYLFKQGIQGSSSENIDIVIGSTYRTVDFTDNYHAGLGQSVGKEITQTKKLYAPLINSETFDFLSDLSQSPVVDQFAGYDGNGDPLWVSVTVATGTVSKSAEHLQDFELILIPNNKIVQSL